MIKPWDTRQGAQDYVLQVVLGLTNVDTLFLQAELNNSQSATFLVELIVIAGAIK